MKINRKTPVGFKGPFDNLAVPAVDVLNRNMVARGLAMFNHLCRKQKQEVSSLKEIFDLWFNGENENKRNYFFKIINFYNKKGIKYGQLGLVNVWSNFYLMNEVLSIEQGNAQELSKSEFENILFLNYLKANDVFNEKSNLAAKKLSLENGEIAKYISKCLVVNSLCNYELTKVEPKNQLVANFYKSFLLLKFLEENYQQIYIAFNKYYNIDSYKEYFKKVLPIALSALKGYHIEDKYTILNTPDDQDVFLERLISNKEILHANIDDDFKDLRANPLVKISEKEYLVFDIILAINRIFSSLFWDVKLINDKAKLIHENWFSIFTFEFIEKYLCYSVLNKIYSKRSYVRFSGEEIKLKFNIDTEPDYYVRNGKKVFIFEVKGSIITGSAKQSFDIELIEEELKKKFYHHGKEKKAIKQLVERILLIVNRDKKACYDANIPNQLCFTPIIISTDITINTPGINFMLNQWFFDEISTIKELENIKINPLVVIDINTLIIYSDVFQFDTSKLESLLYSYISFVNLDVGSLKKKAYINNEHAQQVLDDYITSRMISFGDFCLSKLNLEAPIKEFKDYGYNLFKD